MLFVLFNANRTESNATKTCGAFFSVFHEKQHCPQTVKQLLFMNCCTCLELPNPRPHQGGRYWVDTHWCDAPTHKKCIASRVFVAALLFRFTFIWQRRARQSGPLGFPLLGKPVVHKLVLDQGWIVGPLVGFVWKGFVCIYQPHVMYQRLQVSRITLWRRPCCPLWSPRPSSSAQGCLVKAQGSRSEFSMEVCFNSVEWVTRSPKYRSLPCRSS